ncbi:MAG: bifunctional adenosylcobinamide kinase/adenosylcobinamide-phosphate guanylyltransferase [Roseburia sp.]
MRLVIGGYAQGKLRFVLRRYDVEASMIWDGAIPETRNRQYGSVVINHFHVWVKRRIAEGGHPDEEVLWLINHIPDCIIISDEIGNGIVPVDALEREYRERTGRILVELAARAEEVERVICGIGQRIK